MLDIQHYLKYQSLDKIVLSGGLSVVLLEHHNQFVKLVKG
jgi:hypothetical protein